MSSSLAGAVVPNVYDEATLHGEEVDEKKASLPSNSINNDPVPQTEEDLRLSKDPGVARIEALYLVFGKGWKYWALYGSLAIFFCGYALCSTTTYVYLAFATSSFSAHAELGTISVATSLMSSICQPFISKIADISSRPWALLFSLVWFVVGYIITAASNSVGSVCGGQVIYTIGNTGLSLLTTIILGDITSLQWRGFANGLASVPYIVTAFVSGYITDDISLVNWRWGYGMFTIIIPVCLAPALVILFWGDNRARKLNALSIAASDYEARQRLANEAKSSYWQMVVYYFNIIDGLGLILMGTSFALILLPFTLYASADNGWKNPSMIAMEVVGGVLFIAFIGYEWKIAPHPLVPMRVLNRTFIMCVIIDFMYYFAGYVADTYMLSWVYVVVDWDTRNYTFYSNAETVALCFSGLLAGIAHRYTHRFKWWQVGGLAAQVIGSGLKYAATTSGQPSDALLVCAKVIQSMGGGFSVVGSQVASQASVPHRDMALAIALLALLTNVGGGIGEAIAAAVWTDQLPKNLDTYLGSYLNSTELADVYGSIYVARVTEPRDQVILAYNKTFKPLALAAMILQFVPLVAACFTKNFYLGDTQNAVEETMIVAPEEDALDEAAVLKKAQEDHARARGEEQI